MRDPNICKLLVHFGLNTQSEIQILKGFYSIGEWNGFCQRLGDNSRQTLRLMRFMLLTQKSDVIMYLVMHRSIIKDFFLQPIFRQRPVFSGLFPTKNVIFRIKIEVTKLIF